jgi:hypothetical protein
MTTLFTRPQARTVCYAYACRLRREADRTGDAIKYQMAAAEFRALGMWLAAERCEERGKACKSWA